MSVELLEQNPDIAKKVYDLIVDVSNLKTKMELDQGTLKDMKSRAKTEFGLTAKEFNTFVNLYHNQARDEFEESSTNTIRAFDVISEAGKDKKSFL